MVGEFVDDWAVANQDDVNGQKQALLVFRDGRKIQPADTSFDEQARSHPCFTDATIFNREMAWVRIGDRWGIIDRDAAVVLPLTLRHQDPEPVRGEEEMTDSLRWVEKEAEREWSGSSQVGGHDQPFLFGVGCLMLNQKTREREFRWFPDADLLTEHLLNEFRKQGRELLLVFPGDPPLRGAYVMSRIVGAVVGDLKVEWAGRFLDVLCSDDPACLKTRGQFRGCGEEKGDVAPISRGEVMQFLGFLQRPEAEE